MAEDRTQRYVQPPGFIGHPESSSETCGQGLTVPTKTPAPRDGLQHLPKLLRYTVLAVYSILR